MNNYLPPRGQRLVTTVQKTNQLAKELSQLWSGGEVVALFGELGSGKTTFTQAIGKELMINQPITSPTFAIIQEYECQHSTIKKLIHIDAYRLSSGQDLINLGINDWINNPSCLIIIEWPNKVADWLPNWAWQINFQHQTIGRLITWQQP